MCRMNYLWPSNKMQHKGPQAWDQSSSSKAQEKDQIRGPVKNSSALAKYWLPKESNLGSWVKPVLVAREENKELVYTYFKHTGVAIAWYHRPGRKEQSVGALAKHKKDPDHRLWGEKEESTSHSSQRGDADGAGHILDPSDPEGQHKGEHNTRERGRFWEVCVPVIRTV